MIVDGKPFLMLAGELRNSTTSSLEFMKPVWSKLVALHLNTVLAAVQWELLEPKPGQFDDRFPRAQNKDGKSTGTLSTFAAANVDADSRAFAALMRHVKAVDLHHRVIMIQVENEVGLLGDSRDRSAAANKAFAEPGKRSSAKPRTRMRSSWPGTMRAT